MLTPPPRDEPAERLFRAMLAPRPSRPLRVRLRGAEHVPLVAVAPRWLDERALRDRIFDTPAEVRGDATALGIIAATLHTPTGPAFADADEAAALLDDADIAALAVELPDVLARIAPSYATSDVDAWTLVLLRGAQHPSNARIATSLAWCVDVSHLGTIARPDRFFGIPTGELLDGHWMAFSAARKVFGK